MGVLEKRLLKKALTEGTGGGIWKNLVRAKAEVLMEQRTSILAMFCPEI